MKLFRQLILILLLCSSQTLSFGNDRSFSRLSVENGLSNNLVKAIYKDSFGFIWFGTLEGLDRYDGVEIRPWSSKFPEAVENVYAITEDFGKNLWVGTATGLFCYSTIPDRFDRIRIDSANISVQALAVMPDSNLCVGTTNGLYLVNTKTRHSEHFVFTDLRNYKTSIITGIFPDKHGNCWLSTRSGLVRFSVTDKRKDLFVFKTTPEDAFNSFTSVCNIGNKIYLGTTNNGIVEFDLSAKVFSPGVSLDNNIILTINCDNKELLYAGTDGGGLSVINVRTRQVESIKNQENNPSSISSNSIYSFYLDENNRYWIGTYTGGVNYIKSIAGSFKLHPVTSLYPEANKSIRSFYFAPDGAQYFGTRNGLIQISRKGGVAKFFMANPNDKNGLRSNIILAVYPFMGDILIGTYGGGISRFSVSEQRIKPFLDSQIFSQGNAYGFETDKSGNLWIASFNGIYRYSPSDKRILNFNRQNCELKSDEIFEITFDSKGRLWAGTMSGTSVLTPKGDKLEKTDLPETALNSFKTNYIYEDQAGNIWICTERGGLMMVDPGLKKCKIYRDKDGLPDNSVCAIIESSTGEYWISTLKGFCKFSSLTQKFMRFSISDGLPGLVFSPAANYLAPDGTLYFGNEKGLVYFTPSEATETALKSKIRLTDFYLFGKAVAPGLESAINRPIEAIEEIRLSDRSNSIGFRFVALNYINPTDNKYEYKLEGVDKEWRNNGSNNTVFYEKLKSGNYTFKVRNAGESDDSPNSVKIRIVLYHSIFSSPLFFVFLILLVMSGAFIILKYIKKLQKDGIKPVEIPQKLEKYKGSRISESHSSVIINELKRYMEEKKPYLNAELKLADLASEINYPLHEISQVLNQDLDQSFSDFINKYRVEEVKKCMEDKAFAKYTFIAIAQRCGFNSKTSFYRIFKNETGKTPADYLKELKQH